MNLKKFFSIVLAVVMVVSLLSSSVYAVSPTPTFGGKLDRGITRISWWMSYENNGGWYEYQIINAVNNWKNPGWSNPINFVAASSNSGTMMDFYTKNNDVFYSNYGSNNILAITEFFNINSTKINPTSNYRFTEITINDTNMHNIGATKMKGTITHEIGHALGLAHYNTNVYSIMCQSYVSSSGLRRQVQAVQQCDNTAVVNLYS